MITMMLRIIKENHNNSLCHLRLVRLLALGRAGLLEVDGVLPEPPRTGLK